MGKFYELHCGFDAFGFRSLGVVDNPWNCRNNGSNNNKLVVGRSLAFSYISMLKRENSNLVHWTKKNRESIRYMIYVDKEGALRKTHSIHKLNTFNSERWFLLSHVRAFGEQISTSKITRTLYTCNLRIVLFLYI